MLFKQRIYATGCHLITEGSPTAFESCDLPATPISFMLLLPPQGAVIVVKSTKTQQQSNNFDNDQVISLEWVFSLLQEENTTDCCMP